VYLIDNEDYFQRKYVFHDKENNFYSDNDERSIFFCKGVLETVKKLGWAPDIVHCNDWMTSLIPLYLKTSYKNDPIFKESKSIFSIYNNRFDFKFKADLMEKAKMIDVEEKMLHSLSSADYDGFIKIGTEYADVVINSGEEDKVKLEKLLKDIKYDTIEATEESLDTYYNLYTELTN
jgi:starch synthase